MSLKEKLKKHQYNEIWQQYCGFLDLVHGRIHEDSAAVDGRADPALEQLRTGAVHSEGKASEKSGGIPENGTVDRV